MVSVPELLRLAVQAENKTPAKEATPARFYQIEKHALGNADMTRYTLAITHPLQSDKIEAFRLYDTTGQLVAGEWRAADKRKLYQADTEPEVTTLPPTADKAWITLGKFSLSKPDAGTLRNLLADSNQTVVAETGDSYVITCQFTATEENFRLIKARLTVRRADNQITGQVFLFEGPEEIVEYKLSPLAATAVNLLPDTASVAQMEQELLPAKAVAKEAAPPVTIPVVAVSRNPDERVTTSTEPLNIGLLLSKSVNRPPPIYPLLARTSHQGGMVTVYLELDETGKVSKLIRIEGVTVLRSAAAEAARKWTFTPTISKGQPVRVTGYIVFNFKP